MTVMQRIRRSYPYLVYAAIEYPATNLGLMHGDRNYPHTVLNEDNARETLEGLRYAGWVAVSLFIRATNIPTHTSAAFTIDELLANE